VDYLWSPWRYRYLTGAEKSEDCVFCRIAAEDSDERNLIVFRGQFNFVVLNRFPYTSGHLMVVPFAHAAALSDAEEATCAEMMRLVRTAEVRLKATYHPDGLNLGMNIGQSAGAGIAGHIHMHVLPRWYGDANFMTTVSETRVLPEELDVTWKRVRAAFLSLE